METIAKHILTLIPVPEFFSGLVEPAFGLLLDGES